MELGITGLKKIYGTRQVLSIPRLTVSSGLITAVAGANGAGKTTLLNLLAGLERKDGGEILYDGREEPPFSEMTLVFQEPYLISGTVRKNIAWPMKIRKISKAQIKERVEELAEELGLLPLLERRTDRLSAGEKQKTALARALSFWPRLLLLDEPSANLDRETTAEIERILLKMNRERGTTIIIVTHDLEQAGRLADNVIFLDMGQIRALENLHRK